MGKSNSQTDPRNWVHGKDQNKWNMNWCDLGYTNQSKDANKKATYYQSSAQCIAWQCKNFTNIPKTRAMKGISWTRSKQESNLITNQAYSVLYENAKILPIYQKLEQWKESAEQEANKKTNWLPIKCTVYCMTRQKFYQYTMPFSWSKGSSGISKQMPLKINHKKKQESKFNGLSISWNNLNPAI